MKQKNKHPRNPNPQKLMELRTGQVLPKPKVRRRKKK